MAGQSILFFAICHLVAVFGHSQHNHQKPLGSEQLANLEAKWGTEVYLKLFQMFGSAHNCAVGLYRHHDIRSSSICKMPCGSDSEI
jgi:hypothetical protein